MKYVIVQLRPFLAKARKLGLDQEDVRQIELVIMQNPTAFPVMAGTNGLRKMRYAARASGGGKSGGVRVCYFVIIPADRIYLVTAYGKNEMDNLPLADRNVIAREIAFIKAQVQQE